MKIHEPGNHLDHMLRQTRMHHVHLSMMADTKANILLTMSSVLITLSVPHILEPAFHLAVIVLISFCLATIALAGYALMPKTPLTLRPPAAPDVRSPDFNLLFFGDFARLSWAEYEATMEEMMNDPSATYQAQVRELYTLGRFLARRKYRVLRLAYLSFITGLFASAGVGVIVVF